MEKAKDAKEVKKSEKLQPKLSWKKFYASWYVESIHLLASALIILFAIFFIGALSMNGLMNDDQSCKVVEIHDQSYD